MSQKLNRKAKRPVQFKSVTLGTEFRRLSKKAPALVEFFGAVVMRSFWLTVAAGVLVLTAQVLAK